MALSFELTMSAEPRSVQELASILEDPGFGQFFTDHMAVATWRQDDGWCESVIKPYGPFVLDPSAAVLHYGQEVFEGMKAYRHADDSIWLFRPEVNARRFQHSARRLMLPTLPIEDYLESIRALLAVDDRWVPSSEGEMSLYLRPFMFASEAFLGVRAAHEVVYAVIASPVGPYFKGGVKPIDIWVTDEYSRAGAGGMGSAKAGGNYASSLIAQHEGYKHGCSQVLFVESSSKDRLEELGGMNLFLIMRNGQLVTPELTGSILEGVTRDSILTVAPDLGLTPVERRVTPTELYEGIEDGTIIEAFSCGTAAVLTPIGGFKTPHGEHRLHDEAPPMTLAIRDHILDIQYGRVEDTHGWMRRVG